MATLEWHDLHQRTLAAPLTPLCVQAGLPTGPFLPARAWLPEDFRTHWIWSKLLLLEGPRSRLVQMSIS